MSLIAIELSQVTKQLLPWLVLAHGGLNGAVALLFFYQGWLGNLIYRKRLAAAPGRPFPAVRRHRQMGPWLAALCLLGWLFGIIVVLLTHGTVYVYPPHFILGLVIVLTMGGLYGVSRRIKRLDSGWRKGHRWLGVLILVLLPLQVILGLVLMFTV